MAKAGTQRKRSNEPPKRFIDFLRDSPLTGVELDLTRDQREAVEFQLGAPRHRRLIAAKAGRSGGRDTARQIEEIIRGKAR